jgi:Skp family chaperone for outer membrane proteins
VSIKKKLQNEISKHQSLLQKYQKINEKIKFEQAMMQKNKKPQADEESLIENAKNTKSGNPGDKFFKV